MDPRNAADKEELSSSSSASTSKADELIECTISYSPLRYGIKFADDPNWYEAYSAWRWLATQNTNNSPSTTRPWRSIEKVQEFSFPGCISDYNQQKFIQEIEACLRNEKRPNPRNSLDPEDVAEPVMEDQNFQEIVFEMQEERNFQNHINQVDLQDFPNQADRIRVDLRISDILGFGKAVVSGSIQAIKFAHQNPIGAAKAIGQGGLGFLEFTLRHPELDDFVSQAPVAALVGAGLFTLAQNTETGRALLRGVERFNNAPLQLVNELVDPRAEDKEEQAPRGCWSCVKRFTSKFFKQAKDAVIEAGVINAAAMLPLEVNNNLAEQQIRRFGNP